MTNMQFLLSAGWDLDNGILNLHIHNERYKKTRNQESRATERQRYAMRYCGKFKNVKQVHTLRSVMGRTI